MCTAKVLANMTELRIGAIGCGYWGPNLIRNFVEIPGAVVVLSLIHISEPTRPY